VDQNVTRKKPRKIISRFELAASRMAEAWLEAGEVTVSADDLRPDRVQQLVLRDELAGALGQVAQEGEALRP
jgi:hypothetical protein